MRSGRRVGAILSLALAATWFAQPARADAVHLADGDSFSVGGHRYRLYGIDAPELHQQCTDKAGQSWPCGLRARTELRRLIGTHPVECRTVTVDRFGRAIATCIAGGHDLGREMVRAGYATAYVRPGVAGPYAALEEQARAEQRGIWAGSFDTPHTWRRKNPRSDEAAVAIETPGEWLSRTIRDLKQKLSSWVDALFRR